jgi:hypothetical protein
LVADGVQGVGVGDRSLRAAVLHVGRHHAFDPELDGQRAGLERSFLDSPAVLILADHVEEAIGEHCALSRVAASAVGKVVRPDQRAGGDVALLDAPATRCLTRQVREAAADGRGKGCLWAAADVGERRDHVVDESPVRGVASLHPPTHEVARAGDDEIVPRRRDGVGLPAARYRPSRPEPGVERAARLVTFFYVPGE